MRRRTVSLLFAVALCVNVVCWTLDVGRSQSLTTLTRRTETKPTDSRPLSPVAAVVADSIATNLFPAVVIPSNAAVWLDTTREEAYQHAVKRVSQANSLLMQYGMDALTVTGSYFRLELDVYVESGDSTRVRIRPSVQADLSCPGLEEHWRLLIQSDPSSELPDKDPVHAEADIFSSLRRVIRKSRLSQIDIGAGVKWEWPPVPFVEIDLRRLFYTGSWNIHPDQTFFWADGEGFGSRTSLRLDWWVTDHVTARSESSVRLTESSPGWKWEQTLGLAYMLDSDRGTPRYAIGVEASAFGNYEDGAAAVDLSRATLLYRRPIYRDWLNFRFAGGAEWRSEDENETVPFVRLGLDALYGRKREH